MLQLNAIYKLLRVLKAIGDFFARMEKSIAKLNV